MVASQVMQSAMRVVLSVFTGFCWVGDLCGLGCRTPKTPHRWAGPNLGNLLLVRDDGSERGKVFHNGLLETQSAFVNEDLQIFVPRFVVDFLIVEFFQVAAENITCADLLAPEKFEDRDGTGAGLNCDHSCAAARKNNSGFGFHCAKSRTDL